MQTAKPLGILCREFQVVLQGGRTCESACASILGRRTSLEKMTVAHGGSLKSGKNATVYGAIACVVRPFARTDHASCVKSPFRSCCLSEPVWREFGSSSQGYAAICRANLGETLPPFCAWNPGRAECGNESEVQAAEGLGLTVCTFMIFTFSSPKIVQCIFLCFCESIDLHFLFDFYSANNPLSSTDR